MKYRKLARFIKQLKKAGATQFATKGWQVSFVGPNGESSDVGETNQIGFQISEDDDEE